MDNIKTYIEIEGGTVTYRKSSKGELEFLIIYRHNLNDYTLPKGHTEIEESIEDTALRETQEETGFKVDLIQPLETFEYFVLDQKNGEKAKIIRRVYNFLAEVDGENVGQNLDDGEGQIDVF